MQIINRTDEDDLFGDLNELDLTSDLEDSTGIARGYEESLQTTSKLIEECVTEIKKLSLISSVHKKCIKAALIKGKKRTISINTEHQKKSIAERTDLEEAKSVLYEIINFLETAEFNINTQQTYTATYYDISDFLYSLNSKNNYLSCIEESIFGDKKSKYTSSNTIQTNFDPADLKVFLAKCKDIYLDYDKELNTKKLLQKSPDQYLKQFEESIKINNISDFTYYTDLLPILENLLTSLKNKTFEYDESCPIKAVYQIESIQTEQVTNYSTTTSDTVKLAALNTSLIIKKESSTSRASLPNQKVIKRKDSYHTAMHALKVINGKFNFNFNIDGTIDYESASTGLSLYSIENAVQHNLITHLNAQEPIKVPVIIYDAIEGILYISAVSNIDEYSISVDNFLDSEACKGYDYTNSDVLLNITDYRSTDNQSWLFCEVTATERNYGKQKSISYQLDTGLKMYTNEELGLIIRNKLFNKVAVNPPYYNEIMNTPLTTEEGFINEEAVELFRKAFYAETGQEYDKLLNNANIVQERDKLLKQLSSTKDISDLYNMHTPCGEFKGFELTSNVTPIRKALQDKILQYCLEDNPNYNTSFNFEHVDKVYNAHKKEILQFYAEQLIANLSYFTEVVYKDIMGDIYLQDDNLSIIIRKASNKNNNKFELNIGSFNFGLIQDIVQGYFLLVKHELIPLRDENFFKIQNLENLEDVSLDAFSDLGISFRTLWGYTPTVTSQLKTNLPTTSILLMIIILMKYYNNKLTISSTESEETFMKFKAPNLVLEDKTALGYGNNFYTMQQLNALGFTPDSYADYKEYLYTIISSVLLKNNKYKFFGNLQRPFACEFIINTYIKLMDSVKDAQDPTPIADYLIPRLSNKLGFSEVQDNIPILLSMSYNSGDKVLLDVINYLYSICKTTDRDISKYKSIRATVGGKVKVTKVNFSNEVYEALNELAETCLHLYRFNTTLLKNFILLYTDKLVAKGNLTLQDVEDLKVDLNLKSNPTEKCIPASYLDKLKLNTKYTPTLLSDDIQNGDCVHLIAKDIDFFNSLFLQAFDRMLAKVAKTDNIDTALSDIEKKMTTSIKRTLNLYSHIISISTSLKEAFDENIVNLIMDEIKVTASTVYNHVSSQYKFVTYLNSQLLNALANINIPIDKIRFKSDNVCSLAVLKELYTKSGKIKMCLCAISPFITNKLHRQLDVQYQEIMKKLSTYIINPETNAQPKINPSLLIKNKVLYTKYLRDGDSSILKAVDRDLVPYELLISDKLGEFKEYGEYCIRNLVIECSKALANENYIIEDYLNKSYEEVLDEVLKDNPGLIDFLPLPIKQKHQLL